MNRTCSISLCMITKNEEHCITRCLRSAKQLVDEIIIVDTGSEDNTVKIATEYGARIFPFCWIDDFAAARNYAISKAQGRWILFLDADECLTPLSRQDLLTFIETSPAEGYYFRIDSYLDHEGKSVEDYVVRLFKNTPQYRFIGAIHEQIAGSIQLQNANGGLIFSPFTIAHYGYLQSEMKMKHKFDRNTSLIKKALLENPHDPFLHYCLSIEYLQKKDFTQAGPLLQKTLTLLHGNEGYVAQVLIALLLVKLTEPTNPHTEDFFYKAMQTLPNNGDISCLYGVWLMQGKRFWEATEALERGLLTNRELIDHGQLNALLGDAYFLADMAERAIECYTNALYQASGDLYPLMQILTMPVSGSNPSIWEHLLERLTPEITTTLYRQTLAADMLDLKLATMLLTIVERTRANDTSSMIIGCSNYLAMLKATTATAPLQAHIYTILSVSAEELLLQSQLLQLSPGHSNHIQQTIITSTTKNLLLLSSLIQNSSPTNPLKCWREVFIGETCFDCQSH